jgi:ribosomal protein S27AE
MKNGKCTRCGASDIQKVPNVLGHRDYRALSQFSGVKLNEYVCCNCGLVETYLADMKDVDKIKKKCGKVETTE